MKRIFHAAVPMLLLVEPAFSLPDAYSRNAPKIFVGLDAPHLHLLTNHLPIFVTLSGLIALIVALRTKNQGTRQVALWLILLGVAGGLLTFWLGQQAYKPVRGLADEIGQDWLDLHMERAERFVWVFWLTLASSIAALVMGWRKHRFSTVAVLITGALGLATPGLSSWIADAGGKVRHVEIRGETTPAPADGEGSNSHTH